MTPEQVAAKIRRARDGTELLFKGWTMLVLDYPDCDPPRQVKVSPDPRRPDNGAFWLDVDRFLEEELAALEQHAVLAGSQ